MVNFSNFAITYAYQDLLDANFLNTTGRHWIFLEPAITLRSGYKKVMGQLQIGRSIKITQDKLSYEKKHIEFRSFRKTLNFSKYTLIIIACRQKLQYRDVNFSIDKPKFYFLFMSLVRLCLIFRFEVNNPQSKVW